MASIRTHRDLTAWRESLALVELVYRDTESFPNNEGFGLTQQMRRCVASIPLNIAEGAGRNSPREFVQFLGITCGSLAELDTQVEISVRLGYMDPQSETIKQLHRVGKIVRLLRKALKQRLG